MLIHGMVETDRKNEIVIYGSDKPIQIINLIPEWSKEEEPAFRYRAILYFLSEFTIVNSDPGAEEWLKEYDAYLNESICRGLLIKYIDDKKIKVYTFKI